MILFPAVDILDGDCVRLVKGVREDKTVYGNPVEMAAKWRAKGAEFLHVVDLNGAFDYTRVNLPVIRDLIESVAVPVQLGGGVRTLQDAEFRIEMGVERVILGTGIYHDKGMARDAVRLFGADKIVAGIDCKDGRLAVKGWVESTDVTGIDFGKRLADAGVRTAVFTDIVRDGGLNGVNAEACREMQEATGLKIIASGGVTSMRDLKTLREYGLYGAILGKALYDNKINLEEALR